MFFDENHYFTISLKEIRQDINNFLFDSELLGGLRFYNSAGFLIDEPYIAEPSETGFYYGMDLITRLEAKPKNGKRSKFKFYDLRNDQLLFGLPNVITSEFDKKGILILEKCLGYFGRTKLTTRELMFEDLKFELTHLKMMNETVIKKIYHKDASLDFEYDELICQSKRAYWV